MASTAPSPEDDPYADRRAWPRESVALPAFLQVGSERHAVQLLDLSPGGAKLSCVVSVATGTSVMLDCGTLGRGAVVRWQNGGLLGICFDSELDPRDVADLIARSKALAALIKARG